MMLNENYRKLSRTSVVVIDSQLTLSLWFLRYHHSYAISLSPQDDFLWQKLDLLLYRVYDHQSF